MKIYKTKKGYFYKEYKNGKKIRISKENYLKLKNPKKKNIKNLKKPIKRKYKKIQKGGLTTGNFFNQIQNEYIKRLLSHREEQNFNRKINKTVRNSVSKDMKCKVCNDEIIPKYKNTFMYSSYSPCPYCGYNTHTRCFSDKSYQLYGFDKKTTIRDVKVCKLCSSFLNAVNSNVLNTLNSSIDIILRFGSVFDNVSNFKDLVLVDAAGPYLKTKRPERAGTSAGALYDFIKLKNVKNKATSGTFESLDMGEAITVDYENIKVIHAYSYDFRIPQFQSLTEERCIKELTRIYSKVFNKFIETGKTTLHLLPLSGGVFAGKHKDRMNDITYRAIQKTIQSQIIFQGLQDKIIKLCLFMPNELINYYYTKLYQLENSPSLQRDLDPGIQCNFEKKTKLDNKNLFYLKLLSNTMYESLKNQFPKNKTYLDSELTKNINDGKMNLKLKLFANLETTDLLRCKINYAGIMNALGKLKQEFPDLDIYKLMSKLTLKVQENDYSTYYKHFIFYFYLMVPFHLRFKRYERIYKHKNVLNVSKNNLNPYSHSEKFEFRVHFEGSVGIAKDIYQQNPEKKIGLLIAGNSGSPGGMYCKLLGSDFTRISKLDLTKKESLQEEGTVKAWLTEEYKYFAERFQPEFILNHTIRGQWGLFDLDEDAEKSDFRTLQNIDYTMAEAESYRMSWLCDDCCLNSNNNVRASLVFVAGPNINAIREPNGSMARTKNQILEINLRNKNQKINNREINCSFIQGIKNALTAGLYASYKNGCKVVIVPYVAAGIYLSDNKDIQDRFKKIYPSILWSVLQEIPREEGVKYIDIFDKVILCDLKLCDSKDLKLCISKDLKLSDFENITYITRGDQGAISSATYNGFRVILKGLKCFMTEDKEHIKSKMNKAFRLSHPNICNIYNLFEHTDPKAEVELVYVVMEHIDGDTLTKYLEGNSDLSRRKSNINIRLIFKQFIEGIKYLHDNNVTHRDIKPDNIMIQSDGNSVLVKIVDLDVIEVFNSYTGKINNVFGTPNYLPPEYNTIVTNIRKPNKTKTPENKNSFIRMDIWACGCILYYLFTKQTLPRDFNNNNLRQSRTNQNRNATDLLSKMLNSEPSERITLEGVLEHPFLRQTNQRQSRTNQTQHARTNGSNQNRNNKTQPAQTNQNNNNKRKSRTNQNNKTQPARRNVSNQRESRTNQNTNNIIQKIQKSNNNSNFLNDILTDPKYNELNIMN